MTVYVLLGRTDYEGDTLLGVYTSEQAARDAYDAYLVEAAHRGFDDVVIDPRQLDAAGDWRW